MLAMINLMQGDCLERMKEIPDGSIDMVLTDPPYGMGFQSNASKSGPRYRKIKQDEKVDPRWVAECFRVLKSGGGLASFCNWGTSCIWREHIESAGFTLKSQVIWNRLHHGMGDLKGAFAPMHDIIWYAAKGRRIFFNGRPKSVIEDKRPSPSQDHGHPTCKPVTLMETLIKSIDDGSDGVILDPFMGSGSTGVAAKNLNRSFIGIEMDETYFKIAKERIDAVEA
jgi:DNA modification methylase